MSHPTGAIAATALGFYALIETDWNARALALTGMIGGLLTGGFQYYKYWMDQKQLAFKAAEAIAKANAADQRSDRLEREASQAKEELKQFMRDQLDEYRKHRHEVDNQVNQTVGNVQMEARDNRQAIKVIAGAVAVDLPPDTFHADSELSHDG